MPKFVQTVAVCTFIALCALSPVAIAGITPSECIPCAGDPPQRCAGTCAGVLLCNPVPVTGYGKTGYECCCIGDGCKGGPREIIDPKVAENVGKGRMEFRREARLQAVLADLKEKTIAKKADSKSTDEQNHNIKWEATKVTREVEDGGKQSAVKFSFTNSGQSAVKVESVRATCAGCTGARITGDGEYQPGERGHVAVTVEFPRWERTVTRGIWVTFRRPGGETYMEHLTVKLKRAGQAVKRQTASLD